MDLSVIIPCHNLEKFITPLLVSLNLQDLGDKEVEVIFICDSCTDKTVNTIKDFRFSAGYKNINIYTCEVHSCGLARNIGIERSTGKYIWFVDGDDWITSNKAMTTIISAFEDDVDMIKFAYEHPAFFKYAGHPAMVWQYAYRRSFIGDHRFIKIQPDEDKAFNLVLFKKLGDPERPSDKVKRLNDVLYHYNYMREGSNIQQLETNGKII